MKMMKIPSGQVFYNSSIASIASGYNSSELMHYLINLAHENNILVKAWIPQFHDQIAYNLNSEWRMKMLRKNRVVPFNNGRSEYFVNPIHPDVQAYELSIILEIIQNFAIDSVALDWIRFDDYNMDMSDYTRNLYIAEKGIDPVSINFSSDNNQRREWNLWRSNHIATYIEQVKQSIHLIKPDIPLGIYALSPEWEEVGQNSALFHESIDFIAPLCYYDDCGFNRRLDIWAPLRCHPSKHQAKRCPNTNHSCF